MDYKIFGRRTGLRVSELALGTGNFGTGWGYGSEPEDARKMFDRFAQAGGNFIDTADTYQFGESERLMNLAELSSAAGRRWRAREPLRASRVAARSGAAERARRQVWTALARPPLGDGGSQLAPPERSCGVQASPSGRPGPPPPPRRARQFCEIL